MIRRIAAAVAILALAPAGAMAATQVESSDNVIIVDGDARPNAITISAQDEYVVITEAGAAVADANANDGCAQDGDAVRCDTLQGLYTVLLRGGDGDDTLTADTVIVFVSMSGQAGDDVLNSSASGFETEMAGGAGNDTLNARAGALDLSDSGDAGDDTFTGSPQGLDTFEQEPGADTYAGGTAVFDSPICGIDSAFCGEGDSIGYPAGPVTVTLDGVAGDGQAGEGDNVHADVEMVGGSPAGDTLSAAGSSARHDLSGWAGDDAITGGSGADDLNGGAGADVIAGGPGDDMLWSGQGEDVPAADRLDGGDGDDVLVTGVGADDLTGGAGMDETHFERAAPNGAPADFDVSVDDQPNDGARDAGEGDNVRTDIEIVTTGAGADRLTGSAGPQQLRGGHGDDAIDGGGGVDVLDGGNGADTMTSRDLGFDVVNCGAGADPAAQADEGDQLYNCELSALTPLPPPPDETAPVVALGGSRSVSASAFGRARGVSVTVRTGEPATVAGEAITRGMIARAGELVLGQRTLPLAPAGSRRLTIRFSRSYVRAIQRRLRRRAYTVTVRATATDAAGNRTVVSRRVTIRRAPRRP